MAPFFHYVVLVACVMVIIACICRVDKLRSSTNRYIWFFVYALFSVYAFGTALQVCRGRLIDWDDAAGIGGILLFIIATWSQWTKGPPPETVRGEP